MAVMTRRLMDFKLAGSAYWLRLLCSPYAVPATLRWVASSAPEPPLVPIADYATWQHATSLWITAHQLLLSAMPILDCTVAQERVAARAAALALPPLSGRLQVYSNRKFSGSPEEIPLDVGPASASAIARDPACVAEAYYDAQLLFVAFGATPAIVKGGRAFATALASLQDYWPPRRSTTAPASMHLPSDPTPLPAAHSASFGRTLQRVFAAVTFESPKAVLGSAKLPPLGVLFERIFSLLCCFQSSTGMAPTRLMMTMPWRVGPYFMGQRGPGIQKDLSTPASTRTPVGLVQEIRKGIDSVWQTAERAFAGKTDLEQKFEMRRALFDSLPSAKSAGFGVPGAQLPQLTKNLDASEPLHSGFREAVVRSKMGVQAEIAANVTQPDAGWCAGSPEIGAALSGQTGERHEPGRNERYFQICVAWWMNLLAAIMGWGLTGSTTQQVDSALPHYMATKPLSDGTPTSGVSARLCSRLGTAQTADGLGSDQETTQMHLLAADDATSMQSSVIIQVLQAFVASMRVNAPALYRAYVAEVFLAMGTAVSAADLAAPDDYIMNMIARSYSADLTLFTRAKIRFLVEACKVEVASVPVAYVSPFEATGSGMTTNGNSLTMRAAQMIAADQLQNASYGFKFEGPSSGAAAWGFPAGARGTVSIVEGAVLGDDVIALARAWFTRAQSQALFPFLAMASAITRARSVARESVAAEASKAATCLGGMFLRNPLSGFGCPPSPGGVFGISGEHPPAALPLAERAAQYAARERLVEYGNAPAWVLAPQAAYWMSATQTVVSRSGVPPAWPEPSILVQFRPQEAIETPGTREGETRLQRKVKVCCPGLLILLGAGASFAGELLARYPGMAAWYSAMLAATRLDEVPLSDQPIFSVMRRKPTLSDARTPTFTNTRFSGTDVYRMADHAGFLYVAPRMVLKPPSRKAPPGTKPREVVEWAPVEKPCCTLDGSWVHAVVVPTKVVRHALEGDPRQERLSRGQRALMKWAAAWGKPLTERPEQMRDVSEVPPEYGMNTLMHDLCAVRPLRHKPPELLEIDLPAAPTAVNLGFGFAALTPANASWAVAPYADAFSNRVSASVLLTRALAGVNGSKKKVDAVIRDEPTMRRLEALRALAILLGLDMPPLMLDGALRNAGDPLRSSGFVHPRILAHKPGLAARVSGLTLPTSAEVWATVSELLAGAGKCELRGSTLRCWIEAGAADALLVGSGVRAEQVQAARGLTRQAFLLMASARRALLGWADEYVTSWGQIPLGAGLALVSALPGSGHARFGRDHPEADICVLLDRLTSTTIGSAARSC